MFGVDFAKILHALGFDTIWDRFAFEFLEAGWFTHLENTLFLLRGLVGAIHQYAFVVSRHHLLE